MEPTPNQPPDAAALQAGRDALRVQVAAVAAQQAALALEEDRLRQRAAALERQEAQLAAHLEERRQRLLEAQEQVRSGREALKAERAAAAAELESARVRVLEERAQAVEAGEAARKERQRLVALRKRLRRRWRQHWEGRQDELARRGAELAAQRRGLAEEAAALQRERAALARARGSFNGEAELGRRELQARWDELALTQQQWDTSLNVEHAERERRAAEVAARSAALEERERALTERERLWTRRQSDLAREVQGLEARIHNQRERLAGGIPPTSPPSAERGDAAPDAPPAWATAAPEAVERLVNDLDDQRRHLLEQWERLLASRDWWQAEHARLLADLEAAAGRLDERERLLHGRENEAAAEAVRLRRRQEAAERARCALEGWQARLAAREAALEGERRGLLDEVREREESAALEARRLEELRQRWGVRRRQELEELKAVRARCEDARAGYLALWQECQARRAALAQEQRDHSARALALERLRLELPGRAHDAAAAERRLAKLEQRQRARVKADERELAKGQEAVTAEVARLESDWRRLRDEETGFLNRREELNRLRAAWEKSQADAEAEARRRREELRRLHGRHERDTRELAALREEVERVASNLIEGGEDAPPQGERQAA